MPNSPVNSCPFQELLDEWLDNCRADGLSARTIADYEFVIAKFRWWWVELKGQPPHPKYLTTKTPAPLLLSCANQWKGAEVLTTLAASRNSPRLRLPPMAAPLKSSMPGWNAKTHRANPIQPLGEVQLSQTRPDG